MQNSKFQSKEQWLVELSQAIKDPAKLIEEMALDINHFSEHLHARKLFPVLVPPHFVAKMERGNPNDPLFLQVICQEQEFLQVDGFSKDPLAEQHFPAPNILHKYRNRLLFMIKNSCAVNCRYCFRRHFPYAENKGSKENWQQALMYIAQHHEIEEVIFSGGDPLMAKDEELEFLFNELAKIPHLRRLRIHSRLPVVIPSRITDKFCMLLQTLPLQTILVTHINHPNEIDDKLYLTMTKLKKVGVTLLNQSVLLKNINDNAEILKKLSDKLFAVGILPYYLHLLDKVEGAAHYYISDEQALQIYHHLQTLTSGYLVPKLAREIGGEKNKRLFS